ncbi:SRPBCC domain-containing protein [Bradyrhizobium sp. U87765 SZCCT0134]|uniref:SRPBCC family protein n=1 Tax=Bradyrhizobium sp. U87765 SZCCT0134 TaxID=2807660 RepID=UPI0032E46934
MIHWFGPSETIPGSVKAAMDVRVGGGFRISFSTADGEHHEVGGEYREVVPDQRLVFSWAWHSTPERVSVVTVTIKPDGAGSLLTLNHGQFFDEPARDGHRRGWTGTLDRLEKMFA